MKSNLCEPVSAARTFGGMQHRRPPKQRLKPLQLLTPTVPDDRYEAIVNSSGDAIISNTLTGIITSWNPGAEVIFGYTEREMIGQPMLRLFPIERLDEEYYIVENILAGERVAHFETVRIHKNGKPVNLSVSISPVRDKDGNIVGTAKIARDITAR